IRRGEDDATGDDEARESLPPHPPHPWCPGGATGRRSQDGSPKSLAPRSQGPARETLCQRGPSEQDGPGRLGIISEGGPLSSRRVTSEAGVAWRYRRETLQIWAPTRRLRGQ